MKECPTLTYLHIVTPDIQEEINYCFMYVLMPPMLYESSLKGIKYGSFYIVKNIRATVRTCCLCRSKVAIRDKEKSVFIERGQSTG